MSMDAAAGTPDQLAAALEQYPSWAPEAPVEWIQTHISHVFLVGDRVYKLRKAVRTSFLDFSTRKARNTDCLREVALNRRLAPSVYLGVAAVRADRGGVRVGPVRESLDDPEAEHLVVMRRLPAGRDALSLLERGQLGPAHVEAIAERLQHFHATQGLGEPAPWSPEAWLERNAAPIFSSLSVLAECEPERRERADALEQRIRSRIEALRPRIEQRRLEGRAVDGHGDVHLNHVWFEDERVRPVLIDCLEFDDDLRRIDSAAEVAFLAMDLQYRGRADLAEWFLAAYAGAADDFGLFPVVDLHAAYRALVRAKVAALAAGQVELGDAQRAKARGSAERHLALAESLLEPRDTGGLLVICGTVGSGKSTVARKLAGAGLGVPIAADRVRKRLAGIAPDQHAAAPPDSGIYAGGWTERVYRGLLERAAGVVEAGRTAILDASFARRAHRDAVRAWATQHGVAAQLLEVRCRPDVACARLEERSRIGTDPSDAGPDFLPLSRARFQPPDEWPAADRHVVRTDHPHWATRLFDVLGHKPPWRRAGHDVSRDPTSPTA
ncbi:MAG: AAA family ATPase [Proteobacteria bacterium]|nr:AAA family ATPase [Pseudomonadota bacterium]